MAGFFNRLHTYDYEGLWTAAEELENGIFVKRTADKLNKLTETNTSLKMEVIEKREFWGLPAVEVMVIDEGSEEIYMCSNFVEHHDQWIYNDAEYKIPMGAHVRCRRPEKNDHMVITVAQDLFDSLNVGDAVSAGAQGLLIKG